VGELTDLEDQWMQQYFDYLAKGGIAEGAKLKIERLPVVMKCEDCGMNYTADIRKDGPIVCPSCSSEKKKLVSGRGVFHQEYGGGLSLINNQI
jgi:hydrogenase nickel incorporation protein HypA/HybF